MKIKRFSVVIVGVLAALMLAIPALAASGKDRNGDKLPDRWEKRHDLSLKVNQAKRDQDKDGLRNRGEYRAGTDPRDADSNDDGENDAMDAANGDCPGHGGKGHHRPPPDDTTEVPSS